MKVSDLIDYLGQLDPDAEVVINDEDFEGEGDYVSITSAFVAFDAMEG